MGKKKLILTQKQLDEICGDNSTYLDGLALTPDLGNIYSNEITTNGAIDNAYPKPTTTDDYASDTTNNVRGYWNLRGMGSVSTLREMSKKEWENLILNEENSRLKLRNFGGKDGQSYYSVLKSKKRLEDAEKKLKNGSQEEKVKANKTINRMIKNNPNIKLAIQQYETAKKVDKDIRPAMKSAPKNSGNGKAHSPKKPTNGVFIN